jgi:hypothetical protein
MHQKKTGDLMSFKSFSTGAAVSAVSGSKKNPGSTPADVAGKKIEPAEDIKPSTAPAPRESS